ncbi:hypothetical protein J4470_00775, partial [Candidatus Woesearchaeota archaeon]|nr:hypothetical protein [Candidatus Woesearchaeota archaeon]
GNGCSEEGVIDCISDYDPSSKKVMCKGGDKGCHIETACFEGSFGYSKNSFRPAFNTVMRNHHAAISDNTPRAFGEFNERLICERIEEVTGSAGGICASFS